MAKVAKKPKKYMRRVEGARLLGLPLCDDTAWVFTLECGHERRREGVYFGRDGGLSDPPRALKCLLCESEEHAARAGRRYRCGDLEILIVDPTDPDGRLYKVTVTAYSAKFERHVDTRMVDGDHALARFMVEKAVEIGPHFADAAAGGIVNNNYHIERAL